MKLALLFPGQGSQYIGMGEEFTESLPECKEILTKAEEICSLPLADVCSNGPMEKLTRSTYLQPAITTTNIICLHAFLQKLPDDLQPSYFAGHSLGEYSALYAAGVLTLEDTLRLVSKRGELMEREGEKNPGGMRAVLGLDIEEIEGVLGAYKGDGVATVANHNTSQQVVLSGDIEALDTIAAVFEEKGAKVIPLNVAIANHSPLVEQAVPDFRTYMDTITFSSPEKPVIFNVTGHEESDPAQIKEIMARQIASRVNWYNSIMKMLENGVDTFVEIGPKTVLKGMMRRITPKGTKVKALQVDTPASLDKCIESIVTQS